MLKTCSKCGVIKSLEAFACNSAAKDGRRPSCKECDRKYKGSNHCYRRRPETAPSGQRWCLECGQFKPNSEFGVRTSSRTIQSYYDSYCLVCRCKAQKNWYQRNSTVQCAKIRDRTYGLAPGEYDLLLASQGGKCAICSKMPQDIGTLAVDHDHAVGECRGLLCANCNKGLGYFKDDRELLQNAILYLQRFL